MIPLARSTRDGCRPCEPDEGRVVSANYRILYVGPLWAGSTSTMRRDALRDLGHTVVSLDTTPYNARGSRLARSLRYRLGLGAAVRDLNAALVEQAKSIRPDVLWVDSGHYVWPESLRRVKEVCCCVLVHYNPDDPFGRCRAGWRLFRKCLPIYDVHFVPRDVNVPEYQKAGAPCVVRFPWAYHPSLHRPIELTETERRATGAAVGFVGGWERERYDAIRFLAHRGIPVRVWSAGWPKSGPSDENLRISYDSLWGPDYTRAICAIDINLGFLRKANRDLSTTRSVEVPACGAFLLAERTDEHLALFEEGKEAEFFGSQDELLDKVRYYLAHPDERRRIAAAGRQRCLRSGYSNQERLREMLQKVTEARS